MTPPQWRQAGMILFIVVELYLGGSGWVLYAGPTWGIFVFLIGLALSFGLAVCAGSFLYALMGLEWHWIPAMMLSAPAVILMFPKTFEEVTGWRFGERRSKVG